MTQVLIFAVFDEREVRAAATSRGTCNIVVVDQVRQPADPSLLLGPGAPRMRSHLPACAHTSARALTPPGVRGQVSRQIPLASVKLQAHHSGLHAAAEMSRQATAAAAAAAAAAKRGLRKARIMSLCMRGEYQEAAELYADVLAHAKTLGDRSQQRQLPSWAHELRFYLRDLEREMVVALFPGVRPPPERAHTAPRVCVARVGTRGRVHVHPLTRVARARGPRRAGDPRRV